MKMDFESETHTMFEVVSIKYWKNIYKYSAFEVFVQE